MVVRVVALAARVGCAAACSLVLVGARIRAQAANDNVKKPPLPRAEACTVQLGSVEERFASECSKYPSGQ